MTTREQEPKELALEREFNQGLYEQLFALMEGKPWVEIETETHEIKIEPERICVREGGCLDIDITPIDKNRRYLPKFDYHINHFDGVVEMGIDGDINAEEFGIPGGGVISAFDRYQPERQDPIDPDPDYGKLAKFIINQAAIGKKTFPKPPIQN